MSAAELEDWRAYAQVEKFGFIRDNYHAGIIAKAVYEAHGMKKQGDSDRWHLSDFLLQVQEAAPPRKQSLEEQASILRTIAYVIANSKEV